MVKHEIKSCPRCEGSFECKVGNVLQCQCSEVVISNETASYLEKTHYDCLCKNCMSELDKMVSKSQESEFPRQAGDFVEGIHYYREGGLVVFTEFYHLSRGYCCRSGCRHCAYGYKKM